MLDRTQEQLLILLDEIDKICKENDITYFLDGGSVIGAMRHEGFIPWDNDADLVMTEENYDRFAEIVNRDTEKTHRTVQDITINPNHPLEIGKYINLDMTKITMNTAFWDENEANAGMVVDIIKLMPLPRDEVEKEKRCQLFNIYAEFVNDTLGRCDRRTDYFDEEYRMVVKEGERRGKEVVKKELEEKLFHQTYDESDYYLYCTGSRRHPRVFPREFFDKEPIWVDFENLKMPIMQQYHEFLRMFYGEDYWKIPKTEKDRRVHTPMYSESIPYKYYIRDYMRLRTPESVKGQREEVKKSFVELAVKTKRTAEAICGVNSELIKKSITRRIEIEGIDLKKEFESKNYALLDDLFEEYYRLQFATYCKRWPIVIDLPEEQLYCAVMNLIYARDDIAKAGWIINAYMAEISGELPGMVKNIKTLLDSIFVARAALDYGEYERGWKAINDGLALYPDNWDLKMHQLSYEANLWPLEREPELMNHIARLEEEYPDCVEISKARGDFLWRKGSIEEALSIYDSIFDKTLDGMLKLDITRKRKKYNE